MDVHLAKAYGVTPKRLREQVRRNVARFPAAFILILTGEEVVEVAAKCGDLAGLKYSPSNPYAFTEHGAIMLASVLKSPSAIQASILIVEAFVRMKELLNIKEGIISRVDSLEQKTGKHDLELHELFKTIRQLLSPPKPLPPPPPPPMKRVGYRRNNEES